MVLRSLKPSASTRYPYNFAPRRQIHHQPLSSISVRSVSVDRWTLDHGPRDGDRNRRQLGIGVDVEPVEPDFVAAGRCVGPCDLLDVVQLIPLIQWRSRSPVPDSQLYWRSGSGHGKCHRTLQSFRLVVLVSPGNAHLQPPRRALRDIDLLDKRGRRGRGGLHIYGEDATMETTIISSQSHARRDRLCSILPRVSLHLQKGLWSSYLQFGLSPVALFRCASAFWRLTRPKPHLLLGTASTELRGTAPLISSALRSEAGGLAFLATPEIAC